MGEGQCRVGGWSWQILLATVTSAVMVPGTLLKGQRFVLECTLSPGVPRNK